MKILLNLLLILAAASALAGTEHVTAEIPSSDGLRIHAESWGSGEPVIVFVHGWSCDRGYWSAQVKELAGDYRVVTIDLAGHGQSAAGRKVYTMEAFGQDVAAVLSEWDLANVILVGHSMGGAVIAEAALAAADRIGGLIGIDNYQKVDMTLTGQQIEGFVSTFAQDFPTFTNQWVRTMFPADADSALAATIAGDMASAPPEVALSALEELLAWYGGKAPARLAELKVPMMCINSDMQPTDEAAMLAIIPRYQVRYMNGHGHFLFREDPAAFNKLLRETIAEMVPAKR